MFITFEGIEGSGKSTQIELLARELKGRGHAVVKTREPGGTAISDQIRHILLDSTNVGMVPQCEMLLYWAARAQHVQELILPALGAGKIVLCDRFVDSTIAYQGAARGIELKAIDGLCNLVVGALKIDRTVLFDLPALEGLNRAHKRIANVAGKKKEDRFENEALAFHERVRTGFLNLAHREPERFVVIDATLPEVEVSRQVLQGLAAMLPK